MGLFSKCGPVFLKANSEASIFIEKMQVLLENAEGEYKKEIDRQLKIARYGLARKKRLHLNVIKAIRKNEKNALLKIFFEKNFDNTYKSLVCLANPKTILNDKYAKKEVKDKVVRADQLISCIKKMEQESKNEKSSEKSMRKLAEFFLNSAVSNKSDYAKKYEDILEQINSIIPQKNLTQTDNIIPNEGTLHNNNTLLTAQSIQNQNNSVDLPVDNEKLCPKCGGKLILRTAKRGDYAGSQFYGCENYPKCKFIENIE